MITLRRFYFALVRAGSGSVEARPAEVEPHRDRGAAREAEEGGDVPQGRLHEHDIRGGARELGDPHLLSTSTLIVKRISFKRF